MNNLKWILPIILINNGNGEKFINIILFLAQNSYLGASGGVIICKLSRVSSSLIGCRIYTALYNIQAKSLVNHYGIVIY